jgi:hypothetical protein
MSQPMPDVGQYQFLTFFPLFWDWFSAPYAYVITLPGPTRLHTNQR